MTPAASAPQQAGVRVVSSGPVLIGKLTLVIDCGTVVDSESAKAPVEGDVSRACLRPDIRHLLVDSDERDIYPMLS
jgi:hypothetical protein